MREQPTHRSPPDGLLIREMLGARQDLERQCLQGIARQDRGRFVEGPMARGSTASQVVIVHRGQIVMHEAVDVDQFDRGRGIVERFEAGAERNACRIDERWSQPLAAAQGAVAHRLGQALRAGLRDRQGAIEDRFDAGAIVHRDLSVLILFVALGVEGLQRSFAVALHEDVHAGLCSLERRLALASESDATLEGFQRVFQRQIAGFEFFDELFELRERFFEIRRAFTGHAELLEASLYRSRGASG